MKAGGKLWEDAANWMEKELPKLEKFIPGAENLAKRFPKPGPLADMLASAAGKLVDLEKMGGAKAVPPSRKCHSWARWSRPSTRA